MDSMKWKDAEWIFLMIPARQTADSMCFGLKN